MNTEKTTPSILRMACLLALALAAQGRSEPTDVDPPVMEDINANTDIKVVAPTNTFYGTRGLSQTSSAEALGEGRLIFALHGAWYRQDLEFAGTPNADADIFTGIGAVSYGLSRQVDLFAAVTAYGSNNYDTDKATGLGTLGGGLQGTLPFDPGAPIRMGAQVGIFNGFSDNAINTNGADGYNYFETRTGLDFMAKLIQTLVFGKEDASLKLHLNEGMATSIEDGTEALLKLGAGLQFNLPVTVIGLEINSRTPFSNIDIASDPLWLTPSLQFRTGYNLNLTVGGDVSLSQDRDAPNLRALEPFRLFAGLAFTFDTQEETRRREKEEARRSALEKAKLRNQAVTLTEKSRADSLRAQAQADSMAAKARQDSLAQAEKSRQDSVALADAQKRLAEEKAKRSDMENQLLSTGMLLMDAVYFETGRTDISINSKPYLNIIAKMLAKYPKLQIEVAGHTDNVGSDASNMRLSQGRSDAVVTYLISQASELSGKLTGKGYGESMPKADNTTAAGRKLNRRTELQVLNKEALKEYNP